MLERNRATVDNPDITYNNQFPYLSNKEYWLNHVDYETGEIVAFSGEGARCKVELISRTDLLNARGFKGSSFSISTSYSAVSGSIDVNGDIDFTLTDIYQDPSLLDEDENGDDSDGDNNNDGGGNPPIAGFSKAANGLENGYYYESTETPPADTDSTDIQEETTDVMSIIQRIKQSEPIQFTDSSSGG